MKYVERSAISIYGKKALLKWIKKVKPNLKRWTLDTLNHRPPIYTIEIEDQNCHGLSLEIHYKVIVENELCEHLYIPKESWPENITYELFLEWYSFQYHEEIYDLSSDKIVTSEL